MAKKKYSQRPNGLFETTRTINGRRVRFYGRTCAEIDRKILEYNVNAKKGRKVEVIGKEWLAAREPEIAENTYIVYDRYLTMFLKQFGAKYAGDVKPLELCRYMADFEGKGYKRDTVESQLTVIKQLFAHAVRVGDIDVNPAREVHPSRKPVRGTRRALTEDEERMVEEYRGKDWLLGVMMLYTGLRRGELLAMDWQDIDRKAGTITVNKQLIYPGGRMVLQEKLKSDNGNKPRPLLAPLVAVLPKNRIGHIFPNDQGEYMTTSQFKRRWTRYREGVGLPKDVTPHCFRHSYATICYDAGLDPKEAAAFLGDTEEVIRKVYTELRESRRITSAEKVSAYLQLRAEERAAKTAKA